MMHGLLLVCILALEDQALGKTKLNPQTGWLVFAIISHNRDCIFREPVIDLPNGSIIEAYPNNPDTIRGQHIPSDSGGMNWNSQQTMKTCTMRSSLPLAQLTTN